MHTEIGHNIEEAAALLRAGSLVAIPTETVYGLAGNALNEDAVLSIFKAKNRPFFDPLIVHTHSIDEIRKHVSEIPDRLLPLMERYMPGPLTVLLRRKSVIPDIVTSGLERAAFRIPDHELTLSLLRSLDFPLAAPSANPFGYISPTSAAHVYAQMNGVIPYILDGGDCRVGIESTIVGVEGDAIIVYRLGGLSLEQIQSLVGEVRVVSESSSDPSAPGMLTSHYAPRKPLIIGDIKELIHTYRDKKIAVISFSERYDVPHQYILSPSGDIDEAAKKLFAAMREMDATDADLIIAKSLPEGGLGRAVNDRLKRASHPL
ncbi:MAG: Threonylcarbamoyl-AMP synthase [Bacteroidetes bacterium]|nr:Threonylcarbamoyl-AMP synthase [Bacteroidota bacterium]